jgi:Domain of unknown function (DUF4476)
MKHLLLFITILSSSLSMAQGQGDVTIYSNTGEKFFVVLNGIRQNNQAETNVKITGLTNPWYSCKVISANKTFEIEKNVGVKFDTLTTYRIIEKKGKYKMRYYSEASLGTVTAADPNQNVVTYHSTATPTNTTTNNEIRNDGNVNTGTTTTSTITTTTIDNSNTAKTLDANGNPLTETINMNININENGMSTNIDVNTIDNGRVNSTETITNSTTNNINGNTSYEEITTSSSTITENGQTTHYEETTTVTSTNGGTTTNTITNNSMSNGNTNNGDVYSGGGDMNYTSCYTSDAEVDQLAKQIQAESFPDDQLRVANMAAKNKCMSAAQIKKIAGLFNHSDEQLSFTKTAYDKCSDQSNYYQVMEVFSFPSDKEALEKYINSRR